MKTQLHQNAILGQGGTPFAKINIKSLNFNEVLYEIFSE
jgi:hypothetical protein